MFSYTTNKTVRIHDRRLGIAHLVLVIVALIYVVCDTFLYKRYNIKDAPVPGVIRTSLSDPDTASGTAPYCKSTSPCVSWTSQQILYPNIDGPELFLTTELQFVNYELPANCSSAVVPGAQTLVSGQTVTANITSNEVRSDLMGRAECIYTRGRRDFTQKYFVANIEQYTMPGALVASNSTEARPLLLRRYAFQGSGAPGNASKDSMLVSELLHAAGVNLGASGRSVGIVILARIDYTNEQFSISDESDTLAQYTYHPKVISMPSVRRIELRRNPDGTVTEVLRHGIRVVFQQSGVLGHFDFMTLLIHLGTSILLLTLITYLVEATMLYLLPERGIYTLSKYETPGVVGKSHSSSVNLPFDMNHRSAMLASAAGAISRSESNHRNSNILRVMNPTGLSPYASSDASGTTRGIPARTRSLPPPPPPLTKPHRFNIDRPLTENDRISSASSSVQSHTLHALNGSGDGRDPAAVRLSGIAESVQGRCEPVNAYQLDPEMPNVSPLPLPWMVTNPDAPKSAGSTLSKQNDNSVVSIALANPKTGQSHYNQSIQAAPKSSQIPPSHTSSVDVTAADSTRSTSLVASDAPPQDTAPPAHTSAEAIQEVSNGTPGSAELPNFDGLTVHGRRSQRTYQYEPPTVPSTPARNSMQSNASAALLQQPWPQFTSNESPNSQQSAPTLSARDSIPDIVVHSAQDDDCEPVTIISSHSALPYHISLTDEASTDLKSRLNQDNGSDVGLSSDNNDPAATNEDSRTDSAAVGEFAECFNTSDILVAASAATDASLSISFDCAEERRNI